MSATLVSLLVCLSVAAAAGLGWLIGNAAADDVFGPRNEGGQYSPLYRWLTGRRSK